MNDRARLPRLDRRPRASRSRGRLRQRLEQASRPPRPSPCRALPRRRSARRARRRTGPLRRARPPLARRPPHLVEVRARVAVAAARVDVAHARAGRADLARPVVHRLFHRAHGGAALAGARVQAVPREIEELRADELRRSVFGERERLLGQRHGLGQRVRRQRAARGLLHVPGRRHRLAAELEVARDARVVFAHLARGQRPAPCARRAPTSRSWSHRRARRTRPRA